MDNHYNLPRQDLVPLAVSPLTRELVRQLKRLTPEARNVDALLAPLLVEAIRFCGEAPVTKIKYPPTPNLLRNAIGSRKVVSEWLYKAPSVPAEKPRRKSRKKA